MTVQELCQRFNISTHTIRTWRTRYPSFPRPIGGRRYARYGIAHVEWIQAKFALDHNSISTAAADAHCRDTGVSLAQFVASHERTIKAGGIWDQAF